MTELPVLQFLQVPFHPFLVGTRSFPLSFQLNQVISSALGAVNPWQIKDADETSPLCSDKKKNKIGLSKQRGTTSSSEFQLYPSRRLSVFKNSSWKLIKDKKLRKKSTVQVLCSSHLSGEQVLCCCQLADVHPCSSSMRVIALERSRGKEHHSWDLWGTPHENHPFPEAAKPL